MRPPTLLPGLLSVLACCSPSLQAGNGVAQGEAARAAMAQAAPLLASQRHAPALAALTASHRACLEASLATARHKAAEVDHRLRAIAGQPQPPMAPELGNTMVRCGQIAALRFAAASLLRQEAEAADPDGFREALAGLAAPHGVLTAAMAGCAAATQDLTRFMEDLPQEAERQRPHLAANAERLIQHLTALEAAIGAGAAALAGP